MGRDSLELLVMRKVAVPLAPAIQDPISMMSVHCARLAPGPAAAGLPAGKWHSPGQQGSGEQQHGGDIQ